ncbi:hypothetical protein [Deinococcus sp.]|nr:hypothetical protein [Deinococcus sp.]
MKDFEVWWQNVPENQKPIWMVLCYAVILALGIDLGRTLYSVLH